MSDTTQIIAITAVAGAVTPALTALITRATWPTRIKQAIAFGVAVLLAVGGMVAIYWPDRWQMVAAVIMAAIGVMQTIYTVFKPVWQALRDATTPKVIEGTATVTSADASTYTPEH